MRINKTRFHQFYDTLLYQLVRQEASLKIILNLKNIVKGSVVLGQSLALTEAFTSVIRETCKVLDCDRASVFLIDKKRDMLWTKVAKGAKPIQV